MGRGPTGKFHHPMNDAYVEGTLTCLKPETIKARISSGFPLVLNIEPTNACNLRCIFCPRQITAGRLGVHFLSLAIFKRIIDEAVAYPRLIMLNLHKDGEPLLNRDLPEMVAYAKEKNAAKTIHLNTNGTLLASTCGERLLAAGIDDITISIDAASTRTYHALKKSDRYEHLVQGVKDFIKLRNKTGARTTIRVKIMECDLIPAAEIKAFHALWADIADEVQVTGLHDWSGAIEHLRITDETSEHRFPCALLWYALAVNSNGEVSICNVDWNYSGIVGNVHDQDLHTIWNGRPLKALRQAHLQSRWGQAPVCGQCVVWTSVGDLKGFFQERQEFL